MEKILDRLTDIGVEVPKILPGLAHQIRLPNQSVPVRSLLLADVNESDSMKLQEIGLGENRKLGCGLFIPHKSIAPVGPPIR